MGQILMQLFGGDDLDGALQFFTAGSVFTDYTSKAKDRTTGNVQLFVTTPLTNDAFHFGQALQFDRISIDIAAVPASGSIVVAWEYFNTSAAWVALTAQTTHLDLSAATGRKIEAFDRPTDWATKIENGSDLLFWVRARITSTTAIGEITASQIFAQQDFALALDTTESTQGDDYKPNYQTTVGAALTVVW